MEDALLIAFGIVSVVLTAFFLRTYGMMRVEREARILCEAKLSHLENCEAELAEQRQEVIRLATEAASLRTEIDEKETAHTNEINGLMEIRDEIQNNMKVIAADSLKDNQTSFLRLANEVFEKHKEGAASELGERQKAFGALLEPHQGGGPTLRAQKIPANPPKFFEEGSKG